MASLTSQDGERLTVACDLDQRTVTLAIGSRSAVLTMADAYLLVDDLLEAVERLTWAPRKKKAPPVFPVLVDCGACPGDGRCPACGGSGRKEVDA